MRRFRQALALSPGKLVFYEHDGAVVLEPVVIYGARQAAPRHGGALLVTIKHGDGTLREVDPSRISALDTPSDKDLALQAKLVGEMIRARRLVL